MAASNPDSLRGKQRVFAVVPAAGLGTRMGELTKNGSKSLLALSDRYSVLDLTIRNLASSGVFCGIAAAVRPETDQAISEVLAEAAPELEHFTIPGGETRQQSVFNVLRELRGKADFVAVHDAARPFCRPELIRSVVEKAFETNAAILADPVSSTLKLGSENGVVLSTVPRDRMWEAQTPQVFKFDLLLDAYERAEAEAFSVTDDSGLMEHYGYEVSLVRGDPMNIKITTPNDLELAELLVQRFT